MRYSEYLRSDHWLVTKTHRLRIDGYKCAVCGSRKSLNVHHKSYKRLGHENIKRDLVTLCHACHACLHRLKLMTEREAVQVEQARIKFVARRRLRRKVSDLLVAEIWLRDKSNGGDMIIWYNIDLLCGIVKQLYPWISPARKEITRRLIEMRDTKICELYARSKSPAKVARAMYMQDVKDVLKVHGLGRIK